MKMFYQMAAALFVTIALSACGANSMFEAEPMDSDGSAAMAKTASGNIPEGCVSWFDGCNTCTVKDGEVGACTKMSCKATTADSKCQAFAPEFKAGASAATAVEDDASAPDTMPETQREATADVPANCKIWFDGCNSCVVMGGKLRGCTSKVCTAPTEASCTKSN